MLVINIFVGYHFERKKVFKIIITLLHFFSQKREERIYNSLRVAMYFNNFYDIINPNMNYMTSLEIHKPSVIVIVRIKII